MDEPKMEVSIMVQNTKTFVTTQKKYSGGPHCLPIGAWSLTGSQAGQVTGSVTDVDCEGSSIKQFNVVGRK